MEISGELDFDGSRNSAEDDNAHRFSPMNLEVNDNWVRLLHS